MILFSFEIKDQNCGIAFGNAVFIFGF